MTLTTHAVVGGGVAAILGADPVLGFGIGFVSHFVLDAIPHWDYPIRSRDDFRKPEPFRLINKNIIIDLLSAGVDAILGFLLVYLFIYNHGSFAGFFLGGVFWGAFGGVLPDILQFVYFLVKKWPLTALQHFHTEIVHARLRLDNHMIAGPMIQIAIVVVMILLVN